jgi:hypothetical protein
MVLARGIQRPNKHVIVLVQNPKIQHSRQPLFLGTKGGGGGGHFFFLLESNDPINTVLS